MDGSNNIHQGVRDGMINGVAGGFLEELIKEGESIIFNERKHAALLKEIQKYQAEIFNIRMKLKQFELSVGFAKQLDLHERLRWKIQIGIDSLFRKSNSKIWKRELAKKKELLIPIYFKAVTLELVGDMNGIITNHNRQSREEIPNNVTWKIGTELVKEAFIDDYTDDMDVFRLRIMKRAMVWLASQGLNEEQLGRAGGFFRLTQSWKEMLKPPPDPNPPFYPDSGPLGFPFR